MHPVFHQWIFGRPAGNAAKGKDLQPKVGIFSGRVLTRISAGALPKRFSKHATRGNLIFSRSLHCRQCHIAKHESAAGLAGFLDQFDRRVGDRILPGSECRQMDFDKIRLESIIGIQTNDETPGCLFNCQVARIGDSQVGVVPYGFDPVGIAFDHVP